MKKSLLFLLVSTLMLAAPAGIWPFSSGDKQPRISELMAPATALIEDASDLASEGKVAEAVEKYRAALVEIDRIERENPERLETPEFGTLRTKRAYISAAIDSLLLNQARENAKAVAVSDTTELEKRLNEERPKRKRATRGVQPQTNARPKAKGAAKTVRQAVAPRAASKGEEVMSFIEARDFVTADRLIGEMLSEKPNSAAALNLRALKESAEGDLKAAERTLDQAIQSNPRDPNAYYNMALLYLRQTPPNVNGARRYYETARTYGCPADEELEAQFK